MFCPPKITRCTVYEKVNEEGASKSTYISQFMWRDMSSGYDPNSLAAQALTVASLWHVCTKLCNQWDQLDLKYVANL